MFKVPLAFICLLEICESIPITMLLSYLYIPRVEIDVIGITDIVLGLIDIFPRIP